MQKLLPLTFLFALFVFNAFPALAQQEDFSKQDSALAKQNLNEKLQSNILTAPSGTVSNLPSISLTSLFSDTQAEAKFSVNAGESMFNFGLSQSFSQKPKTATFLDQDGVTTGTTFSVAWQRTIGRTKIPSRLPISNLQKYIEVKAKVRERKKIDPSLDVTFQDMDESDKKELIEGGALDLDAFATPWIFTVKFSASRVGFEYITDSLAARPSSDTRIGKNFNVAFSKFKSLYTYFSFSYSYLINFESGSESLAYTFPVGPSGHAYTKDVTVGYPGRYHESRVRGEMRQMIRRKRVPIFGINPSVTYLVQTSRLNVELPVYFLTKREDGDFNGLQAGFKAGYISSVNYFIDNLFASNSDSFYFGLFITKPFSIR